MLVKAKRWIDVLFWVAIIAVIVIGFFLPKTGQYVLIDQFFTILCLCMIGGYVIFGVVKQGKAVDIKQKSIRIAVIVGCLIGMFWVSKNFVLDIVKGTVQIELHEVEVSKSQGRFGILSSHYYLKGTDEDGNTERFEISADDYTSLQRRENVEVVYYKYTDRVYRIR